MNRKILAAAVSAAVLGFAAASANAAIVVSVGGTLLAGQGQTSNFNGLPGYTTFDFNLDTLGGLPTSYTGNGRVVIGSLGGQYANPQRPGAPNNSQYLSVPSTVSGEVSIAAPSLSSYFGLWWGSVDDYNRISFLRNGVTVGSFEGSFLRTQPDPGLTAGTQTQAAYFNFAASAGSEFDTVVLRSTQMALESDNHVFGTAVVPVPGAAALLMSGMLGMLFAARRQRKGLQVA